MKELRSMHKFSLIIALSSVVLTSCLGKPKTAVPTEAALAEVNAPQTAIALTQAAMPPTSTITPRPTFTTVPTSTAFPTFTPMPTVNLTPLSSVFVPNLSELPCEAIRNLGGIDDKHEEESYQFANEKFTMIWGIKNIGSCDLGPGYVMEYVSGEEMGDTKGKLKTVLSPMENGKVSVDLQAPSKPGTYVTVFKFHNPQGYYFGPGFSKTVIVPNTTCKPENQPGVDYGLYVVTERAADGTIKKAQFWSEKYWDASGIYEWKEIYLWLVLLWSDNPINYGNYGPAQCSTFDDNIVGPYITKY